MKNPPRPKNGGFPAWTEDDVERYELRFPIGTKERVWLGVLLSTAACAAATRCTSGVSMSAMASRRFVLKRLVLLSRFLFFLHLTKFFKLAPAAT